MKKILIATDFSTSSRNASRYAIELAKEVNAEVYLFNSYKIPNAAPGLNTTISRYDIMMQTDKRLLEEADAIDAGRKDIEIICDEGEPADAILKLAKEKLVDFIIVGMKGSGKNFKKIFGSTATALAGNCIVPLIIVPENSKYQSPKVLVYASDSIVANSTIPAGLKEIISLFNSKLFVVEVVKEKPADNEAGSISNEGLENFPGAMFEYAIDSDINHALHESITNHSANMLAMVPHKHEWIERLFKKSETKEMIFHTEVPLLILPESPD
ncbi:MAG: universal stress protein [Ginsengibacter sp.]